MLCQQTEHFVGHPRGDLIAVQHPGRDLGCSKRPLEFIESFVVDAAPNLGVAEHPSST